MAHGILMMTRQGGRNKASLYAVTFQPINECGGKLDIAPTDIAPGDWKKISGEIETCAPNTGQLGAAGGAMAAKSSSGV